MRDIPFKRDSTKKPVVVNSFVNNYLLPFAPDDALSIFPKNFEGARGYTLPQRKMFCHLYLPGG